MHILRSMNHFQSETMNSSAKLYSGLKPPTIFESPKKVRVCILPYTSILHKNTISSVTRRMPTLRSRDTWRGHCKLGHHIAKHVIKLVRRMQSWRNVVSARSHDTAVRPTIYKHGRKGGFVTRSCAHFCSAGVRLRRIKVRQLLSYEMSSSMTFSNVSLLPSGSDAFKETIGEAMEWQNATLYVE